jgi:hypothetical protein
VRSSAGQHVRSHSSKNVAVFLKCVRPQRRCVRPQKSTASLSGVRARTQARCARTQTRERSGIGGSAFDRNEGAFDRTVCSLNFPETEQNA